MGKKLSIGSSPTFIPAMPLTPLLLLIVPPAATPLLTSSLLPFLLPFGECFRTWVLIASQLSLPSLFLHSPPPKECRFPLVPRKLVGITLLFTSIHRVFLRKNTPLSFATALSTFLALNAAKSSKRFGCVQRQPQAWCSFEVKEAITERRKVFASAHGSDEAHGMFRPSSPRLRRDTRHALSHKF